MSRSRTVALYLVPGILVIAVFWFLLSSRAREHERVRAERPVAREAAPAAKATVPPSKEVSAPPPVENPPPPPPRVAVPAPPPATVERTQLPEAPVPFLQRPAREEIPGLQAKAQDLSADPKDRLAALTRLRIAQPDGRSPEVVRSMIDLLRTSSDPAIRADVCRQLNRVVSEDLKQQLLITGRTDADAATREEAVESLGPMKADPVVRQFLETSLATDPSEKVRNQAQRSLSGRR